MTEPPQIAIIIKTYNRPERIQKCVTAIEAHCNVPYRLYIGDDGEITEDVESLYQRLEKDGHFIRRYDAYISVTKARNELVAETDEDFILRIDDDFLFCTNTDIRAMLSLLDKMPTLGAISGIEQQLGDGKGVKSGAFSGRQGHMFVHDRTLYKISIPVDQWIWSYIDGVRFSTAGFTRNFLLIRKVVFGNVVWNEDLVIQGEHEAFMLDLKKAGWLLGFTPDSYHIHDETGHHSSPTYQEARKQSYGYQQQYIAFQNRYGVEKIENVRTPDIIQAIKKPGLTSKTFKKLKRFISRHDKASI